MFEKYRVKSNDSIEDIAKMFRTNKEFLVDLNNLSYDETLREGMDLIVPKNKEKYFDTYTINKGDSLYGISRKYNINPNLLAAINGLNLDDYIYPNQVIMLPVSGYSYYVTAEGDTLNSVSDIFKKLATDITTVYAKDATLTDTIGGNFKFTSSNDNVKVNGQNVSFSIDKLTPQSQSFSFNITIDDENITEDGWYPTNDGFNLT